MSESAPRSEIHTALSEGAFTVDSVTFNGQTAVQKCTTAQNQYEFEFVFEYQGVWDTEKSEYVTEPEDATFDTENWTDDGTNLTVPCSNYNQYERSYRLEKCVSDGDAVASY